MLDLVSIGEILIDFTPAGENDDGIELFAKNAGGAPANVAVAVSKLGGYSAFIGKVGKDQWGVYLEDVLKEKGVNTEGFIKSRDGAKTTLAFVHLGEDGERSFSFHRKYHADVTLTFEEVPKYLLENTKVVHFGSVSLTDNPSRTATIESVKYAKEIGKIISFDPNYRKPLWESEEVAIKTILEVLPLVDILKISEEELYMLTGRHDIEEGALLLQQKGVQLVFVTLGKKGSFYRLRDNSGIIEGYTVNAIDTNGAGDSFLGAIHYKLASYYNEGLYKLTKEVLEESIRFANGVASLVTTRKGAIPAMPTTEEVQNHIQSY